MPNHEFENYLALVSRLMRLNRSQKESIRLELRDHLETRISELVESGVDVNLATRRALEEFGDAAVLAREFQGIFQLTRRRWMMRFATFSIAGTFLAAVLIMAMWPSSARFGAPNSSIAQDVPDSIADDDSSLPGALAVDSINTTIASTQPKPLPSRTIWSSEDVDRKLQQPADFDFIETPMREVLDMLRDEQGLNVLLDESARTDLDEDTLVTFNIKNVRLATALRLLLSKHNATYVVQDGILRLISLDFAGDPEFFRRRMFDCRQLLDSINNAEQDRIGTPIGFNLLEKHTASTSPSGGVFNQVSSLPGLSITDLTSDSFVLAQQDEAAESRTTNSITESIPSVNTDAVQTENSNRQTQPLPVEQVIVQRVTAESILIDLVKLSVTPDSWHDTNGDATLTIVGGFMIVNHTEESLDDIGNLIGELEKRMK